ncbi:MAG: hypothetical protein JW765_04420, partial [Deltaproteobacteria bacterium]|nr:hypothetical protein [Candidatus Zymogenaceae bacterium]
MGVREHPVGHSHVKANGAARSLGFASTARALRILVISDDTKTLALFKKALPHTGARGKRSPLFRLTLCRRADQGLAAVKKSARDGLTFSVVFLDG